MRARAWLRSPFFTDGLRFATGTLKIKMASQQESGGGIVAAASTNDDEVPIVSAGTNKSTRRARIAPTLIDNGASLPSPPKRAHDHVSEHTSSLTPGLAPLLKEKGMTFLSPSHRLYLKQKNIDRMEADEDYIPVSARVAFYIQAWKEAEESPEYATLNTETSTIFTSFQLQIKEQNIKNLALECEAIRVKLHSDMCESLFAALSIHLEVLGKNPEFAHEMVLSILQENGTALLKQIILTVPDVTAHCGTVLNVPKDTQAMASLVNQCHTIRRVLVNFFSNSWEEFLSQQRENELSISLRKKAKENLQSAATEAAAIELDTEIPAPQQKLQDIVIREATKISDKRMNSLRQYIATLKTLVATKNGERGKSQGASVKKEKKPGKHKAKSGKRDRDATGNATDIHSGDESDWTQVSNRCRKCNNNGQQKQCQQQTRNNGHPPPPPTNRKIAMQTVRIQQTATTTIRKQATEKVHNVAHVPDRGIEAAMEAEGAIAPLAS
jgi:hypothetical protein